MMKLMEILVNMPIEELQGLAFRLGVPGFSNSKAELMRNILVFMTNTQFVKEILRKLTPKDNEVLKYVLTSSDCNRTLAYVLRDEQDRNHEGAGEPRVHQQIMIDYGLLYQLNDEIILPDELRDVLKECLVDELNECLTGEPPENMEIVACGDTFYEDVYFFLAYLKNNQVRMTRHDTVYQRNVDHLRGLFSDDDESGLVFKDMTGKALLTFDDRFSMIRAFCFRRGLIEQCEFELSLLPEADVWFRQTKEHIIRDIYGVLIRSELGQSLILTHCLTIMQGLLEQGVWILFGNFSERVRSMHAACNEETVDLETVLRQRLIIPLTNLGLIETGIAEGQILAFRVTELGQLILSEESSHTIEEITTGVIVQPTFEVIVPRHFSFASRWIFESIAELVSTGKVLHYRMTRATLIKGYKEGHTIEAVLHFLENIISEPLPQNVRQSLQDWSEILGAVSFSNLTLLRCSSPDVADVIQAIPKMRVLVLSQLSPVDLVVESDNIERIRDILEANDIIPVPGVVLPNVLFPQEQSGGVPPEDVDSDENH